MEFQIRSGLIIEAREFVDCLVGRAGFPAGGLDTSPPLLGNFVSSEQGGVTQFKVQSTSTSKHISQIQIHSSITSPSPHPLSKITTPIPSLLDAPAPAPLNSTNGPEYNLSNLCHLQQTPPPETKSDEMKLKGKTKKKDLRYNFTFSA